MRRHKNEQRTALCFPLLQFLDRENQYPTLSLFPRQTFRHIRLTPSLMSSIGMKARNEERRGAPMQHKVLSDEKQEETARPEARTVEKNRRRGQWAFARW